MKKITISIIGAGLISSEFDEPDSKLFLTHSHAIKSIDNFEIIGIYDVSKTKTKNASIKWKINPIYDFNTLMNLKADIILIAVPDQYHESYLKKIINYKPKLVVCEKPLTANYYSSKNIISLYNKNQINLILSYQRRYDKDINNIKNDYENGKYGKIISGNVVYSKGFKHNGSHAIDTLQYIFGSPEKFDVISKNYDFYDEDPTVSGTLIFKDFNILFNSFNEKICSVFEIDLLFEKTRIKLLDSGLIIKKYNIQNDPVYKNYKYFKLIEERNSTISYSLKEMWLEICDYMSTKKPLKSNANSCLITEKITNLV